MRNLDLDLLRTLVTIEKTSTFSGAAEQLHKTQSAVTQQMQRLESQLEVSLFQKQGRHRILTSQGKQLANYARRLLAINDEAMRTIGQKQMEGEIRFGAPLDVADTLLPPILTFIAQQAPRVRLEIRVDRSPFLMDALEAGELDMTISTRHDTRLNGFTLRTTPTAWICAADYVLNMHAPLALILADEPSIFRRIALEALNQTKLNWHINYLAPTLVGIKAAVRAGLGVTARSVEFLEPDMRIISETNGLPPLPPVTYMLWARKDTISPLTLNLFEILKEKFSQEDAQINA
ncbi:LysR substrate-binding domain-containing protein [Alcaligenes faecalis]|uniref:LysR substrate-binding domain-containing protein n=1 Tax=Alcaligenes TaxID=507 RepID=UPI00052CF080|nr:LysR substrate-binding domain-containing protein [Alcaligenes faecalis]KGP00584.1 LysR family transcriptional regulator [Alcaligenes faecalis]MCM2559331.1 LysR substrate-binding domain-containing protein [Alcaligenes faecalis]MCM2622167.1 LysR substrate-binding domain-containing protein [Alcaligenes faecalis]MDK7587868.1 LysR substrate-binding domain-containing protein [Alcaligenes phenolicus]